MKKRYLGILLLSLLLVGCGQKKCISSDGDNSDTTSGDIDEGKWRLDLHYNYDEAGLYQTLYVSDGSYGQRPAVAPTRSGYDFSGWFEDNKALVPFVFSSTKITANWNIYAGWEPSSVTPPTKYTVVWTQGASYSYAAVTGTLPTLAEEGTVVSFKVNIANGYEGIPTVKANTTTLTPAVGVYSFTLNEATTITVTGLTPIATDTYRIYYSNRNNWASVSVYMWKDGTSPVVQNSAWPGMAMLQDPAAHNYYYVELDLSTNVFDKLIFNNGIVGTGEAKTINLDLITSYSNGTIYMGLGAAPIPEAFTGQEDVGPDINYSTWGICGNAEGGLSWSSPLYLIENEDGSASLEINLVVGAEFKITNTTTWHGYNALAESNAKANFGPSTDGGNDKNIKCLVAGKYLVSFKNTIITITLAA